MIQFILNNTTVTTALPPGMSLLEVIRREYRLTGSKLACGEGECGACTILLGRVTKSGMQYQSMTSCITPLINVLGQHVVTIEGINSANLTPVQEAMVAANGTQCGFCTPGFVMSMTGELMNQSASTCERLVAAADGNICRCTGYKSIERAAALIAKEFDSRSDMPLNYLIETGVVPDWFVAIPERLSQLQSQSARKTPASSSMYLGGGTDLYVQQPHGMPTAEVVPVSHMAALHGIHCENGVCTIGAAETMASLQSSDVLNNMFPGFTRYFAPIGSTQIRNMATVAGNLVNASPIGDMTIMFLALDSVIILSDGSSTRQVKLKDFYLGYKQLDKRDDEFVQCIQFNIPGEFTKFHFNRVCKRTYLDVATVNSACLLKMDGANVVQEIHLSVGGVAAIPLYLKETSKVLEGKPLNPGTIRHAAALLQQEISPISDIRGSEQYKRLLARQLFFTHMTALSGITLTELLPA